MLRPSRLSRLSTALALFGALAATTTAGCKKSADTAGPDGGGGGATTGGGVVLRYKASAAKLTETVNVAFTLSGAQTGAMKADLTGLLDISPAGAEKLRVGFSVLDVRNFEVSGALKPEPKDGKPVPDLKAKLLEAKGARVVDLLGDADKDASKALPENTKKEGAPVDEYDMSSFGSFLGLPPEMPKDGLTEGKPHKISKEDKENLNGIEVDMDVETTYTLVKIDSSSGKRVAEIKIESESSGAKELSQGGKTMMLAVDIASESTVQFNLDEQLPVSAHIESTTTFSAGSEFSVESRIVMDSTYAPAA